MKILTTMILSVFFFAACGSSQPQRQPVTSEESSPPPVEDPTAPDQNANCGVSAEPDVPVTPEQCTCLGGEVKGDIGDGQVRCDDGQRELARVATGIEGGVCCAAADQTAP